MTEFCSYQECKCIVQTSTSRPEPDCKLGLPRDPAKPRTVHMMPEPHSDPYVQAKVMTVNRTRRGALDAVGRYLELTAIKNDDAKRRYWLTVKSHLQNSSFD